MYLVYGVTGAHGFADDEDAFVGRFVQSFVDVVDDQFFIFDEPVHTLAYHAEAFLYGFFESAAYGHHFSHRFHAAAQFAGYAVEFTQVPAGNFAHYIVECRFEEGRSRLRYRVFQVEKSVTESQFGGDESQWIPRCFRCECRGTAQTGVYFDDAVVFRFGVESILHVAFPNDTDMANDAYGQLAQFVVFAVGQCLGGSDDDTFARVDTQRVEVFHVAHRDAVVKAVAHDFIFDFFPAFEGFFD